MMRFSSKITKLFSWLNSACSLNPTSRMPGIWAQQFKARYGRAPTPLDIRAEQWMVPVDLFDWDDLIHAPYRCVEREEQLLAVLQEDFEPGTWINDNMGVIWFGNSDDAMRFKLMS